MRFLKLGAAAVLLAIVAFSIYGTVRATTPKAQASQLGLVGSEAEFKFLRAKGVPVSTYASWESWDMQRPPTELLAQASALGATPFINWQPLDNLEPKGPRFSLPTIIAGGDDAYITEWAEGIKAYGGPVYLRIAHEMNGSWYPWSEHGSAAYIKAWRHIWGIFNAVGADNAQFVWSPDGLIGHSQRSWQKGVVKWFPGDRYVDYVGMSTVVFKTSESYGIGYFFKRIDFLRRRYNKPVVLPETKVVAFARYEWLGQLRAELATRPWIKLLIWSDTESTAQAAGQFGTGNMNWTLQHDPRARVLLARATD